jgi:hypothetical protein
MDSERRTFSKDWYGTSNLLARVFRSPSNPAGRRNEIVVVDGFRLGKTASFAWVQST